MVGISGTSSTGALHCYYGCKGKKEKKCKRKNIPKDYIENLVIDKAVSILTNENINEIAAAVYEAAYKEQDHSKIKQLQREILKLERKKQNLFNALQECDMTELRKPILEQLKSIEQRKVDVEKEIRTEENSRFNYTIPQIKAFFKNIRKEENRNDLKYRRMIVNSLINKIYVYDTTLTIIFNTQDKDLTIKMPDIEELEKSFMSNSSFNGNNARPFFALFQGDLREFVKIQKL